MVRSKATVAVGCLSVLALCSGGVYALPSLEVENHFETGIVDIDLAEYQIGEDNVEVPWVDNPIVLPNDKISKIPRIHNNGNDCYVRAKLSFRDTDEVSEDDIFGMSDKWKKSDDGFWYYTDVLQTGEDVDIFQGIKIPINLSQDMEGHKFYLDIDTDAIQSKNFNPDFDSASPWGSVEILQCGKEGMYDISTFKQSESNSFQIVYQGDTKKLISNKEDFFVNIPYIMPGDKYSDSIKLSNTGSNAIKLYFRSESEDPSELLDKIQLKIYSNIGGERKEIYSGSLRATNLSENILLGLIEKSTDGSFDFEIYVPEELNNKYSISDSYVKWIFSVEEVTNESTESGKGVSTVVKNVKTGDDMNVLKYLCTALIGGVGFIILLFRRKR